MPRITHKLCCTFDKVSAFIVATSVRFVFVVATLDIVEFCWLYWIWNAWSSTAIAVVIETTTKRSPLVIHFISAKIVGIVLLGRDARRLQDILFPVAITVADIDILELEFVFVSSEIKVQHQRNKEDGTTAMTLFRTSISSSVYVFFFSLILLLLLLLLSKQLGSTILDIFEVISFLFSSTFSDNRHKPIQPAASIDVIIPSSLLDTIICMSALWKHSIDNVVVLFNAFLECFKEHSLDFSDVWSHSINVVLGSKPPPLPWPLLLEHQDNVIFHGDGSIEGDDAVGWECCCKIASTQFAPVVCFWFCFCSVLFIVFILALVSIMEYKHEAANKWEPNFGIWPPSSVSDQTVLVTAREGLAQSPSMHQTVTVQPIFLWEGDTPTIKCLVLAGTSISIVDDGLFVDFLFWLFLFVLFAISSFSSSSSKLFQTTPIHILWCCTHVNEVNVLPARFPATLTTGHHVVSSLLSFVEPSCILHSSQIWAWPFVVNVNTIPLYFVEFDADKEDKDDKEDKEEDGSHSWVITVEEWNKVVEV